jgi:hypothetical protein
MRMHPSNSQALLDRKQVETLARQLRVHLDAINALLPFILFLSEHDQLSDEDRRKIVIGIYLSTMSGIFSGAEPRMGAFARNKVATAPSFPLQDLVALVKREYGIKGTSKNRSRLRSRTAQE